MPQAKGRALPLASQQGRASCCRGRQAIVLNSWKYHYTEPSEKGGSVCLCVSVRNFGDFSAAVYGVDIQRFALRNHSLVAQGRP